VESIKVNALFVPPWDEINDSYYFEFGNFFEPKNKRCSKKCASPEYSLGSFPYPTLTPKHAAD